MSTIKAFTITGTIAAFVFAAGAAQAAFVGSPTYCSSYAGGPNPDGMNVSDATYGAAGPSTGPFVNASDCYGVVGGNVNSAADINGLALTWGTNFLLADGTDLSGGPVSLFGGSFTFSLTGPVNGTTSGLYTLTATDNNGAAPPNFPFALDFILTPKASDRYGLYFFDDVTFDGSGGGTWSVTFLNNGGNIPGLSHMDVFVREGSSSSSTGGTASGDAPEPSSSALALLGLGLIGASFWTRRRSQGR